MKKTILILIPALLLFYSCSKSDSEVTPPVPAIPIISGFSPLEASIGDTVVIEGNGFGTNASDVSVEFSNGSARIVALTNVKITTIIPTNAATGKITVSVGSQTLSSTSNFVLSTNQWMKREAFFGSKRSAAMVFGIGDAVIAGMGGGGSINTGFLIDIWSYNANDSQSNWIQKANFGGLPSKSGITFTIGNKGYYVLGDNSGANWNETWEYDPILDTWTQKADFPGPYRMQSIGFAVGGKGYIGLGALGAYTMFNDIWQYDPASDTWAKKADFPGRGRETGVAFAIGGKAYIGTGMESATASILKDFWEYNPATDQWTQKADFGGGQRWMAAAFTIKGKGYVGVGQGVSQRKKDFWQYDPSTDKWTKRADFPGSASTGVIGVNTNHHSYFVFGADGYYNGTYGSTNELWEYIP